MSKAIPDSSYDSVGPNPICLEQTLYCSRDRNFTYRLTNIGLYFNCNICKNSQLFSSQMLARPSAFSVSTCSWIYMQMKVLRKHVFSVQIYFSTDYSRFLSWINYPLQWCTRTKLYIHGHDKVFCKLIIFFINYQIVSFLWNMLTLTCKSYFIGATLMILLNTIKKQSNFVQP